MKSYNKLSELPDFEDLCWKVLSEKDKTWSVMDSNTFFYSEFEEIKKGIEKGTFTVEDYQQKIINYWGCYNVNEDLNEHFNPQHDYIFTNGELHHFSLDSKMLPILFERRIDDRDIVEVAEEEEDGRKIIEINGKWFDSEAVEDDAEADRFAIAYQFGIDPNTLDYDEGFDRWTDGDKYFNVSEEDRFKGSTEVQFGDYCLYVTDVSKYINQTIDRSHLNEVMDKVLSNYKVVDGELKDLPVEIAMFSSFRNWQDDTENKNGEPGTSFEYYDYLMESDEGLDEFIEELAEKIDAVVYTEYDNIYIYKNK